MSETKLINVYVRDVHDWCLSYFHFRKYNEEKSYVKKVVVPKRANYTIKQTELVTITQGLTTFTQSNCNVAACDGIMVK